MKARARKNSAAARSGFSEEVLGKIPPAAWAVLALSAAAILGLGLADERTWIQGDEALMGLYAIGLDRQWSWKFFYDFGQIPPLSIWATTGLLKLGCDSFFSLWFPSALACGLAVAAGVAAARRFFSDSLALIFGFLLVFNYWFFILGRTSSEGVWVLPWVLGCAWCLGRFFQASPQNRSREALGLGLAAGLGSLTFTSWPAVLLWLLIVLAVWARFHGWRPALFFLTGLGLGLLPFLTAVGQEGFGQHIASNGIWSPWIPWGEKLTKAASYLAALFVGVQTPTVFDPQIGGELNPLQDAAVLAGLWALLRQRREPASLIIALALCLFLLPGILSMDREMYRVIQVLPALLWAAALGLGTLLARAPMKWRWVLLALFLVLGALWDGTRIARALPRPPGVGLPQDWQAFQAIQDTTRHLGPGLILCDFPADSDESLFTVSYPLNAAENPRLHPEEAKWAALVLDRDYFERVSPLFPGSSWVWLEPSGPGVKNWVMGLIPLTASNQVLVQKWTTAHHFFWRAAESIHNINGPSSYQEAAAFLQSGRELVRGDRFLSACYWESLGEFYYHYGYQEHYEDHVEALRQAIQQGYPAAHLYFKLGSLLLRKGDRAGALGAFQEALRLNPRDETAQDGLNLALSLGSQGPSSP